MIFLFLWTFHVTDSDTTPAHLLGHDVDNEDQDLGFVLSCFITYYSFST